MRNTAPGSALAGNDRLIDPAEWMEALAASSACGSTEVITALASPTARAHSKRSSRRPTRRAPGLMQ
jgi:hypothetical protein